VKSIVHQISLRIIALSLACPHALQNHSQIVFQAIASNLAFSMMTLIILEIPMIILAKNPALSINIRIMPRDFAQRTVPDPPLKIIILNTVFLLAI